MGRDDVVADRGDMKRVYLWAFEAGNSDDGDCRWRPGRQVCKL
jgi:hypothetical protein